MATNKRGRQPVDCVFFASFSTTWLPPFWADVGLCGPRARRLGDRDQHRPPYQRAAMSDNPPGKL
jgi:hypothetical protein